MPNHVLEFDLFSYSKLEGFARRANQQNNLGDKGDWLNHFIWGLDGLRARVLGVKLNYSAVHSWELTKAVALSGIHVYDLNEYYVSTILFNMDSAIECMIFMLNALGYTVDPSQFRDVANPEELKRISPRNILSDEAKYKVSGYANYFPSLRNYWFENRDLICKIAEEHDVSKHRSAIFEGGMHRLDPPAGFFEDLGISDKGKQMAISPFAEITLPSQPKIPWRQRDHVEYEDITKLENIAEKFREFINICGVKILDDVGNNIRLTN